MARWLLPVLPALLADGAMAFPTPPEQTAEQISNFARIRAAAKVASEAATPQVLAYFDSAPFRSMLKDCCPKELLRRYRAEAQVSELAHALPAQMKDIFSDVTVKEVGEMAWFPNEFQVALIHHRNTSAGASPVNDLAQKDVFGCKPFAGPEPTWSEVANRLIYIAHNMRRLDSGSEPFFGDFTVIFNSTHVKDSVVIAPYDTGLFVMGCFHPDLPLPGHLNRSMLPPLNCSAWTRGAPPPGTLEYLDHLILPNLAASTNTTVTNRTMLDSARALFSRSAMSEIDYQDVPALGMETLGDYLESDILANPRLPEAVKFGIGSFPTLFGTEDGQDLRQIAKRLKWPLFWSFGTGNPTVEDPHMSVGLRFKSNLRIADPGNIALTTNASVSNTAAETFQRVWQEAAAVRSKRNATKDDVHQWWGALSDQLRVAPISATSCHSVHDCVAVDLSGECICVGQQKVEQLAFTV